MTERTPERPVTGVSNDHDLPTTTASTPRRDDSTVEDFDVLNAKALAMVTSALLRFPDRGACMLNVGHWRLSVARAVPSVMETERGATSAAAMGQNETGAG